MTNNNQNVYQLLQFVALCVVLWEIFVKKNVKGISLKTQELILLSSILSFFEFKFDSNEDGWSFAPFVSILFTLCSTIICYKMRFDNEIGYRSDLDMKRWKNLLLLITGILTGFLLPNWIAEVASDNFSDSISIYLWSFSFLLKPISLIPQIQMYKHYNYSQQQEEVDVVSGGYFTIIMGLSYIFYDFACMEKGDYIEYIEYSSFDVRKLFYHIDFLAEWFLVLLLIAGLTGFSGCCCRTTTTTITTSGDYNDSIGCCLFCQNIPWCTFLNVVLAQTLFFLVIWYSGFLVGFLIPIVLFMYFFRFYKCCKKKNNKQQLNVDEEIPISTTIDDALNSSETTVTLGNNNDQITDKGDTDNASAVPLDVLREQEKEFVDEENNNNYGEDTNYDTIASNNNNALLSFLWQPDIKITFLTLVSWIFVFFLCLYVESYDDEYKEFIEFAILPSILLLICWSGKFIRSTNAGLPYQVLEVHEMSAIGATTLNDIAPTTVPVAHATMTTDLTLTIEDEDNNNKNSNSNNMPSSLSSTSPVSLEEGDKLSNPLLTMKENKGDNKKVSTDINKKEEDKKEKYNPPAL